VYQKDVFPNYEDHEENLDEEKATFKHIGIGEVGGRTILITPVITATSSSHSRLPVHKKKS